MPHLESETRFKRLIRTLERYTKTDLRYLAKGGFWLGIDEVVGALAAFGLAIAFAYYVPKDTYGTYRYLIAAFWTLTAFTMTGLPAAIGRAVAKGREGTFRASLPYSVLWGLPLALIAAGAGLYYFIHENSTLGYGFLLIALFGPFMQAAYLWGSYLNGKRDFRMTALCGSLFALLPALALLAAMLLNPSPLVLLSVYFSAAVVTGLLIAAFIFFYYRPNRELDPESRNLGWHFSAMNLLATIAQQVDKLVVFHYLGAIELAVYSFATALPEQIKNLFGSVTTLAMPKFVTRPFKEIRANFWGRLWLYTGGLTVVALAYVAIAPFAFAIFFPAYTEAIWYSQLYALSLIPIGGNLSVTLLQAHRANRELYILNIISPVFQIGALIILTSLYGLAGAIIARIAARVLALIIGGILVEVYAFRLRSGISN